MKKLLIPLVLMLFIVSCRKNMGPNVPGTEIPFVQFSADGLSYIQLPVNKYFIYLDSATAIEDSVVVVNSAIDKVFVPAVTGSLFGGSGAYYYQLYTLKIKSKSFPAGDDWFAGSAKASSSEIFGLTAYYGQLPYSVFIYPLQDRLIASFTVQGKTYTNVEKYESEHISSNPAEEISIIYYWAQGVGIIKRQIKTLGKIKTESLLRHG